MKRVNGQVQKVIKATVFIVCVFFAGIALADGNGSYLKHQYTYTQEGSVTAAVFRPYLPRDDTILIGAMLELVNKVYGKHQIANLKPNIINRNGRNLIRFHGVGYEYLFLIVKQDTGEVNGFSMWREPA